MNKKPISTWYLGAAIGFTYLVLKFGDPYEAIWGLLSLILFLLHTIIVIMVER